MSGGEGNHGAGARCEDVSGEELSAHVDGALDREEAAELGAHLRACAACRERRAGLVRARDAVRALGGKKTESPFFLEKLDARMETELAIDGLGIKGSAGSGRYTRRKPRETSYVRVAASVIIIIGASIAVRYAWNEWKHPKGDGKGIAKGPEYAPEQPKIVERPALPHYPEDEPQPAVVENVPPPQTPAPPVIPKREEAVVQTPPRQPVPEKQAPPTSPVQPLPPLPRSDKPSSQLVAIVKSARASLADRREALYELANRHESADIFKQLLDSNGKSDLYGDAWDAIAHYPWNEGADAIVAGARWNPDAAVSAIAQIESPDVLAYLVATVLQEDPRRSGKTTALVRGLARAHAEGLVDAIVTLLGKTTDVELRSTLFEALGDAGGDQAAQVLAGALPLEKEDAARVAICRGLARTAGKGELAALARALERDRSAVVRAAAAQAIGRRPLREQETFALTSALRDSDIRVRSAAAVAVAMVDAARAPNPGLNVAPGAAPLLPLQSQGVLIVFDGAPSMQASGLLDRALEESNRFLDAMPAGSPFDVGFVTPSGLQRHSPGRLAAADAATTRAAEVFLAGAARPKKEAPDESAALLDAMLRGKGSVDSIIFVTDGAFAANVKGQLRFPSGSIAFVSPAVYIVLVGDPIDPMRFDNPYDGRLVSPGLAFLRRLAEDSGGALVRNDHRMKLILTLCTFLVGAALAAPARGADVPPLKEFPQRWANAGPDVQRKLDVIEWLTSREQSDGVVKILVTIGTTEAEDSTVIESAVKHLAAFDASSAGEPYLESELEKAKAWPERAIIARAIGRRKNPAAIIPLVKALADKQWEVVAAAIDGLSRQREKDAIEALLKAFEADSEQKDDGARRLTGDYKDALSKLTGEHLGNAQDWRNWWNDKKADFRFPSADAAAVVEQEGVTGEREPRLFTEVNSRRVCFIIDTSFSMTIWTGAAKGKDNPLGLTRFQCMLKEARRVVEEMPVGAKFNVIAFDTTVKPMGPKLVVASDTTKKTAVKFIETLKPAGETNSYGALEAAFADKDVDTIYFLSDGFPTAGKFVDFTKICTEVAKWNTTRYVKIHTIAFVAGDGKKLGVIEGDKSMPKAFMQKLAEDNGGHYRVVE